MSLDLQARFCLSFCHESRQKDNRYSVQCGIGRNPRGEFAAIRFRHRDIEQDKIPLKALRCLMSFARVVLFIDEVAARPFQHELGRVGKIAVVIDYQDARFLFGLFKGPREKIHFDSSIHDVSISTRALYWASIPPSTTREVPVVNFASSEQR